MLLHCAFLPQFIVSRDQIAEEEERKARAAAKQPVITDKDVGEGRPPQQLWPWASSALLLSCL